MTITLYRAVCEEEFAASLSTGKLTLTHNSLEGKWFAESLQDAIFWGVELTRLFATAQDKIIAVDFPRDVADRFFRIALLDGIGPARFVTADELSLSLSIREAKT